MRTVPSSIGRKISISSRWRLAEVFAAICCILQGQAVLAVGRWTALNATANSPIGIMLLLSDGTVMAQQIGGTAWYRLTPNNGNYVSGSWSALPPMRYARNHYSSVVLRDGRVFVIGGEQGTDPGSGDGDVFDPTVEPNGAWTPAATIPPALWVPSGTCGFCDSSSMTLPDGKVLEQPVFYQSYGTLIYDPKTDSWAGGGTPLVGQDEATWLKLPDNSILSADPDNIHSERYIPALNQWIRDRNVPVQLYSNGEEGAALLLPNGKGLFLGGSGHTAIYTPTGTTNMGTWEAGPEIPKNLAIGDGPAAMMVNGRALCIFGTTVLDGATDGPFYFYEYQTNTSLGPNGGFVATSTPLDSSGIL